MPPSLPRLWTGWSNFAQTTGVVASELIDLVHDAYLGDRAVRDFLLRENPAAAHAIAERLERRAAQRLVASAAQRHRPADRGGGACAVTVLRPRGACPGLSTPMPTGDGLLVRFMAAAPLRLDAFAALCAGARRYGNGTMEISARGGMQVRGLTADSAPCFAAEVAALDIAAHDGRVIASPLDDAADGLIDADALAAELRGAIAAAGLALAPKVSVGVDGGGRLHLDGVSADVRLRAISGGAACDGGATHASPSPQGGGEKRGRQRPRLWVAFRAEDGNERALGSIAPHEAAAVVVALLRAIAAHGGRSADLITAGAGALLLADFGVTGPAPPLPQRAPAEPVGRHPLRDGTLALGVAAAFGHTTADALADLAHHAAASGCRAVRPAPGRALLLIGVADANAARLADAAARIGFIVDAGDPRRRIVACPGAPACVSGLIAARAIASALVPALVSTLAPSDAGAVIHVSGCAKGCAHPAAAAVTVVGTERGCGIVRNGTARGAPSRHVAPADIAAEIGAAAIVETAHG